MKKSVCVFSEIIGEITFIHMIKHPVHTVRMIANKIWITNFFSARHIICTYTKLQA